MDVEDDDLVALRSAALASLAPKPKMEEKKEEEEEDLEALRLAALMTRRQNQKIQVIGGLYKQPALKPMPHVNPAIFRKPWNTTNLISLTPDPNAVRHPPPVRLPYAPRVPARNITASVTPVAEAKVPDKFSRYISDSSSDDDDDHVAKPKDDESDEDEGGQSDAESAISERSFSSISDVEDQPVPDDNDQPATDNSEKKEVESDDDTSDKRGSGSDDNILIIDNGEDDILAAIDDFLEDRPEKEKPKKEEKKDKIKKRDGKDDATNRKQVVTGKDHKDSTGSKALSSDGKKPLKVSLKPVNEPQKPNQRTSKMLPVKSEKPIPIRINADKREQSQKQRKGVSDRTQREMPKTSVDRIPPSDRESEVQQIPVAMRSLPSPPRQRRDSDLDSVGTSDLSFLASDSEDEKRTKDEDKVKTRKKSSSSNDSERRKEERKRDSKENMTSREKTGSRSRGGVPDGKRRERQKDKKDSSEQPQNDQQGGDLRKKLEIKGLKKKKVVNESKGTAVKPSSKSSSPVRSGPKRTPEEPPKTLTPVLKTGVINLKKKSSRIPEKPRTRSNSREKSPHIVNLPDINEARRIIIRRPNTSASASSNDFSRTKNDRPKEEIDLTRTKRPRIKMQELTPEEDEKLTDEKPILNKKRSVLPPNTPVERKRQKIKELTSKRTSVEERSPTPEKKEESESEDESKSSSEEEIIEEEEIFAIDDSSIPVFDDVLGDVASYDVGEYSAGRKKSVRKYSQSKSKKKKKNRSSPAEGSRYRAAPDSRRIVPKSSPVRFSDGEDEERRWSKKKPKDSSNRPKRSVYERLGVSRGRSESPLPRNDPYRSRDPSPQEDEDKLDLTSDHEIESPGQQNRGGRGERPKVISSAVHISRNKRWSEESDEADDYNLSDVSEDLLPQKDLKSKKKDEDSSSRKRKRKIKIAGKSYGGQEESSESQLQSKRRTKEKPDKRFNVRDRLGKVILSSVLQQPPPEGKGRRIVDSEEGGTKKKPPKRQKDNKPRRRDVVNKGKREDFLEARIRRIKEQNGQILRRQKEIELEKEKFGF